MPNLIHLEMFSPLHRNLPNLKNRGKICPRGVLAYGGILPRAERVSTKGVDEGLKRLTVLSGGLIAKVKVCYWRGARVSLHSRLYSTEPMEKSDTETQTPSPGTGTGPKPGGRTAFWRRPWVIVAGTVLLGAAFFLGLGYLAESFTHETTDDAFLDAHVVAVAPKVAGRVRQVPVADNQEVAAGALLVEIDPKDLQVQLDQKQAAVGAAQANVELIKASVELFRTQIATAEAAAKQSGAEAAASEASSQLAAANLKRGQELFGNRTISQQEFDALKATATAAEANLRAAREKAASDQSRIGQAQAQLEAGRRGYERAEAQTRQAELDAKAAELNLSYTRVYAPEAGRVTKKAVVAGDYVQIGQNLMALVPDQLFVTANFKETQLTDLRTNQPAKVSIDAMSDRTFNAHVDSIMAGSGAQFSLLPPENAVGNYVKVVQRVPVKLVFDEPLPPGHVLGPGMSVEPSVRVANFEIPEFWVGLAALFLAVICGVLWWRVGRRRT